MTAYTKSTNFASKDSLASGNPLKIVKGTEIDTEFNNIVTAIGTKADSASPTLTGVPAAPTASVGTNTTQIATTAFVAAAVVSADVSAALALKAPLASPALTGVPTAPTAAPGTNTTQLATTAFVAAANTLQDTATALKAPLASPALTGVPTAPTAAVDTNTTQLATTAFVVAQAATATPLIDGTAAVGTSKKYAREDHKHPSPNIDIGTAIATTSGTSVTFNSIPSWVKRITFMLAGFSTNGSSIPQFRLGTNSGLEVTGYVGETGAFGGSGATGIITSTVGVPLQNSYGASQLLSGTITCVLMNASTNTWVITAVLGNTNNVMTFVGYSKALALPLTQVNLSTVNATDLFNAGSVNILYE